ncbi:MAG TPA: fatty acid oxidation complex subunit alpha FadB [Steroidobacteraceae bacterium]|nr:fatty acid oxidation complex subunit alpha FadB [Steroidobacteraceae bacterium]
MTYQGSAISVSVSDDGIAELKFDLAGDSVNKLNRATFGELEKAVEALAGIEGLRGICVTSGKDVFIVGADITEFGALFAQGEEAIVSDVLATDRLFSRFEDLPVPTVVAINGICLGGGMEFALCCDYRVASTAATVGLPEVKLGIFPGLGGTVRLPRVIGLDTAVEWIATGNDRKPDAALKEGAVDAVVAPEKLKAAALAMLEQCIAGKLDWQARRAEKKAPLKLNATEQAMAFTTAGAVIAAQAGPNYPAPRLALENMKAAARLERDAALEVEARHFAKAATTPQAEALIGLYIADQAVKKIARSWEKKASFQIREAAVLGAGIMGGGVAYQSAVKGTPIIMKDIRDEALELGMHEAGKLLSRQVEKGRLDATDMSKTLARIRPTLNYGDFGGVDFVIEAVVENPKVKKAVLAEVENAVGENAILASNTSTISITSLAEGLKRPANFLGMHFFNPVHRMPLVEVIRGKESSDAAVAATVQYAQRLGKTPVVVNDCPGFLVNRVLFPYFGGFHQLLRDGADFVACDKALERFGWPMGPAYLLDVVGIDTAVHAAGVMAAGFPDRMNPDYQTATSVLFEKERYGQKNGRGYYVYQPDRKGRPRKTVDPEVYALIGPVTATRKEFEAEQIVARCMIPMANEVARCLEDRIVATPYEADMALIMGLGFPPFRGGACRYMDQLGLDRFISLCDKYADLGPLYEPPQLIREMAANRRRFFG